MTTFVFTITNIENGAFDYNTIEGVYLNLEDAKAVENQQLKAQADIWRVKPTILRSIKGYMKQIEVKHPTMDIVKIYTLQKVEEKA